MADYEYFDHDADIGVIGRGATLDETFESAARGTFAIMAHLGGARSPRRAMARAGR